MEVFYFGEQTRQLFGALDRPREKAHSGLVFCPPFGEEMAVTYARLAIWGKRLARNGYAVLRYHPYGTGESGGSFADFTITGALRDTLEAVNCLRERTGVERWGFFGLRFGAFLAVQAALTSSPDFMILWSPVINLRQYIRQLLRSRLTAEMIHLHKQQVQLTTKDMVKEFEAGSSVDILGYEFSSELYGEMNAGAEWPSAPASPKVLCLSRLIEKAQVASLPGGWTNPGGKVDLKSFSEIPFWEEFSSMFPGKFADASVSWLESN